MGYLDQFKLSQDMDFQNRTWAALCTEAQAKPADPKSAVILASPFTGQSAFMPYLATAPGFGDKYASGGSAAITDGDLLSAVQAAWPLVQFPAVP